MALETFNYIDSLVPDNPVVSDGLVNGDDHMRGIKLTLKNTFPNIKGQVTASQADLNSLVGGATKLSGAGVYFSTNTTDGFLNTIAGDIDVSLQGVIAATFQRTAGVNFFKVNGGIQATGEIKGPGITPIGAAVMWFDDVLPTDGLWAWANGQVIANANTVAPVLLARWGSKYGGNGTTTMGVPNMQEVVPVGKSGMGGATAPNLLASIAAGVKTVVATLMGTDTNTLANANLPAHQHAVYLRDNGHSHQYSGPFRAGWEANGNGAGLTANTSTQTTAGATSNITIGSVNGTANDNLTASVGSGAAVNNVQPSRVVNWIIRLG